MGSGGGRGESSGWAGRWGAWLQREVLPLPFTPRDLGLRGIKCHTLDILAPHLQVLHSPSLLPLEFPSGADHR